MAMNGKRSAVFDVRAVFLDKNFRVSGKDGRYQELLHLLKKL
jgi:hypothetical protein